MRAFDVVGIGLALLFVPLLAWWLGRFAGRRDWRIGWLLTAAVLLAVVVQIDLLAALTFFDMRHAAGVTLETQLARLGGRIVEAALAPEFSIFLMIFAAFVAMLGWSATPVRAKAAWQPQNQPPPPMPSPMPASDPPTMSR